MNYVIAKIKRDKNYRKVYSGESIFQFTIDRSSLIEYAPTRLLDEDEWFVIKNFSQKSYCINLLTDNFRTTDFSLLNKVDIEKIEYICSYESECFFFQRIYKYNIMSKKYISLGDNVELRKEKNIVINEYPDAVYYKEEDILIFRKLQTIVSIFKGIDELYKEATKEEIDEFLSNDFLLLENDYGEDKIKTMNRKRIALARDTLKDFSKKQRKKVLEYTHQYYPQLPYKNGVFTISNEEELKYLLYGIEQRFYTTEVTNEKRVANSVVVLEV